MSNLNLEEFMEELNGSSNNEFTADLGERMSYDSLLQSVTGIGKAIELNQVSSPGSMVPNVNPAMDLTAALFSSMTDDEMLNHFIPVPGIDFEQRGYETDLLKKDKKNENEEITPVYSADEFLPHRMMPHLNPAFDANASTFKTVHNTKKTNENSAEAAPAIIEFEDDMQFGEFSDQECEEASVPKQVNSELPVHEPHVIKKRKPRTYKYNPKPLRHKICRSFVPDDLKDPDYWSRRQRNNEAAKKSREERRKKELELLNSYEIMKQEYSQIKIENIRLKARNMVLEKQIAELKCELKG